MQELVVQDVLEKQIFTNGLKGQPSLPTILATAVDIAEGMAFLHYRGIVHGDLCGEQCCNSTLVLDESWQKTLAFSSKQSAVSCSQTLDC